MAESYDEVVYPSFTFAQSHPDRLGAIATLFGMFPAPVERCRVLELGCSDGSNLIPMAFSLPESRFVGVDLAGKQIEIGAARAAALGLDNIRLLPLDIMEIRREFGEFDYIVAHGLYSWVPPEVREKIFEIGRECLAPQGVLYVSYNTLPGGYLRRMVREILLYHIRGIENPSERIRESLALARHIINWQNREDKERELLRAEFERLLGYDPNHMYHDDLADCNEPVYFRDLIQQASRNGLQYLGEADFHEMFGPPIGSPEPDAPKLPSPGDRIEFEQYLDFLRCRRFRQTLLCRDGIALDRSTPPSRLNSLYLSSPLRPESETPDLGPGKAERFVGPKKSEVETDFPPSKAALVVLGEIYPANLPFGELLKRSRALVAAGQTNGDDWPAHVAEGLGRMMLRLHEVGAVELAAGRSRFTVEISECPQASRLAREQLKTGQVVVNQMHRLLEIPDDKARRLVQLADGTRDVAALHRDLTLAAGAEVKTDAIEQNLRNCARAALLVA